MTAVVLALPVVIIPLIAWLLWDIGRQQARREAARQAAIKAARDRYVIRLAVDTYPFMKAMERIAKQLAAIDWDATRNALRKIEEATRDAEAKR